MEQYFSCPHLIQPDVSNKLLWMVQNQIVKM